MNWKASILLLLCSYSLTIPLSAAQITGLYTAEVRVPDQSAAIRAQAIAIALQKVLIKITGISSVNQTTAARDLLSQAKNYVQEYQYMEIAPLTRPDDASSSAVSGLKLSVKFAPEALAKALQKRGFSLWDNERPTALVWLTVQDANGARIVNAEDTSNDDFYQSLQQAAADRGLIFIWPLLDLDDLNKINLSELSGHFQQPIQAASARYYPDVIVAITMQQTTDGWLSRWSVYQQGKDSSWQLRSTDLHKLLNAGMDRLLDFLTPRFANMPPSTASLPFAIVIHNIHDHASYVKAMKYLASLSSVVGVTPYRFTADTVSFHLQSYIDPAALATTVRLGNTLEPINVDGLEYRFQP